MEQLNWIEILEFTVKIGIGTGICYMIIIKPLIDALKLEAKNESLRNKIKTQQIKINLLEQMKGD